MGQHFGPSLIAVSGLARIERHAVLHGRVWYSPCYSLCCCWSRLACLGPNQVSCSVSSLLLIILGTCKKEGASRLRQEVAGKLPIHPPNGRFFLEGKLVAPLIAAPNVDRAIEYKKDGQKAMLQATRVIHACRKESLFFF